MAVPIMVSMVAYPDVPGPAEHARVDVAGAALSAVGLAATVYALIESQQHGWVDPLVTASLVVGVAALLGFVAWEHRAPQPMLPLRLFANRNFAGANLATAFVYGALMLGSLSTALYIQEVAGYSAIVAGLITLPTPHPVVAVPPPRRAHGRTDRTEGFSDGGTGAGRVGDAAHPPLSTRIQHRHRPAARQGRAGRRPG